jgi:DNA-binding transcriptional regulator LsrR (DeoR family)
MPRPPLKRQDRQDFLEGSYGALTQGEIAVKAGVTRRTIERDVHRWKASGRYDEWLDERWHGLLEDPEIQKKLKFIALTRIKLRRMVEKVETKGEVTIRMVGLGDKHPTAVKPGGADLRPVSTAEKVS